MFAVVAGTRTTTLRIMLVFVPNGDHTGNRQSSPPLGCVWLPRPLMAALRVVVVLCCAAAVVSGGWPSRAVTFSGNVTVDFPEDDAGVFGTRVW